MTRPTLALALAGCLLAGCAGTPAPVTATVTLADACGAYSNALDKLTPLKAAGKLSMPTVAAVNTSIALTSPLCSTGAAPTDVNSAVTIVSGEAMEILAIVQGGGK